MSVNYVFVFSSASDWTVNHPEHQMSLRWLCAKCGKLNANVIISKMLTKIMKTCRCLACIMLTCNPACSVLACLHLLAITKQEVLQWGGTRKDVHPLFKAKIFEQLLLKFVSALLWMLSVHREWFQPFLFCLVISSVCTYQKCMARKSWILISSFAVHFGHNCEFFFSCQTCLKTTYAQLFYVIL